ncbi:MAG: UDP-N-acetylenolpyruvoylglucosamine reductase [Lachnospiraceae bacterium]|nr:UDP-N-acetylenolpyruvoylglucosamine reductase [Lachnospiraceae bacterium]
MTALRQTAIKELEKLPEDKINFILQIMQGVNGLYDDTKSERKEAFKRLEKLRKKGTITDYDAELASYREQKYGK